MSKTNVIIFRNGCPIRHNEPVYYGGDPILCVTYYKYLGSDVFVKALLDSRRTDISVTSTSQTCGGITNTLALDLLDKLVLPLLIYIALVWGIAYAGLYI